LRPPSARLIIIVVSVLWRLMRRSSAGSPNTADPARDWCRETRHIGEKVHRHPSSHRYFSVIARDLSPEKIIAAKVCGPVYTP
jgi:hypothetical protein